MNTLICAFISWYKHNSNQGIVESDFWFAFFFVLLTTIVINKKFINIYINLTAISLISIPFIFISMIYSSLSKLRLSIQTQSYFLLSILILLFISFLYSNVKFTDFINEISTYYKNILKTKKLHLFQLTLFVFTIVILQFLF